MQSIGIIPARYHSSRFPGKPLAMIGNKSMIQRVYEKASLSDLDRVVITTDDERIAEHVTRFGAQVIVTSPDIENGTLRCSAAYKELDKSYDIIINIQGDEPFIEPRQLNLLLNAFKQDDVEIATLAEKFKTIEDLESDTNIKIVCNKHDEALYFSRSVIPYLRGVPQNNWLSKQSYLKHIGIYAFRAAVFSELVKLRPVEIELSESLEQLRWLFHGYRIKVLKTTYYGVSVDTPEDLKQANILLESLYE